MINSRDTTTFNNPVVFEDFADNDIFLGPDNAYYFSGSNMHYSPGAPILRSYDLVNWKFIGHSVPTLSWSFKYDMASGQAAYVKGTWASTMRYRKTNDLWYWIGCIEFTRTYIYTAPAVTGPWTLKSTLNKCYYDCGLLIDDDDLMYVVYGNKNISIAQLSSDGLSEAKSQQVLTAPSGISQMEGNRMYKRNGIYYVLNDVPGPSITYIWKAINPWGPWSYKVLQKGIGSPITGGGTPHQGSLIETQSGDWYFMSFTWSYPAGRIPVLAPITWGSDDFPILTTVNGRWGVSYPNPLPIKYVPAWTGIDTFRGPKLGVAWEWNHNPDASKYAVKNGLKLSTVTVTADLYKARNTLTHRVHGPMPNATIEVDFSNMADGDRCGLAAFRDKSGYIGVVRRNTTYTVVMRHNITQETSKWTTTSVGYTETSHIVSKGKIWLRGVMDSRPTGTKQVIFSYSTDGSSFKALGTSFTMTTDWHYFMGYRWGIFNFATEALGGSVLISSFAQF